MFDSKAYYWALAAGSGLYTVYMMTQQQPEWQIIGMGAIAASNVYFAVNKKE